MLIYIFSIIFLIGFSNCVLINASFNESQIWETKIFHSDQTTIKVPQLDTKYCYVNITLKFKDPSFLIMAEYKQYPKNSHISKYKQGEKIDRISQLENRGTRFLKLKGQSGDIYISVMADYSENQYDISIIGSNDEICENQCFSNGICQSDGCHCQNSFIGNDCSQQSQDLISENKYDIYFDSYQQIRFFSINLQFLIGQTLALYFQTDCQNCLTIIIYKSKALLQSDFDKNQNYLQMFQIEDHQTQIFTQIPIPFPSNQNILNFAVLNKKSDNQQIKLQIGFNQQISQNDETEILTLPLIIVLAIIGTIIFGAILFCCIRKYLQKNNANDNRVSNVGNINQIELNINEKPEYCGICQTGLDDPTQKIVKINCQQSHLFHQNCIQTQKDKICPLCQQPFDQSEIFQNYIIPN